MGCTASQSGILKCLGGRSDLANFRAPIIEEPRVAAGGYDKDAEIVVEVNIEGCLDITTDDGMRSTSFKREGRLGQSEC
jgi:hypothetical protein